MTTVAAQTTTLTRPTVVRTIAEYAEAMDAVRSSGRTVGVVPTMGALHDGHRSLIQRAAAECDVVAVSIFVNPTQFGDPADLAHYPRSFESDLDAIASSGGQVVFAPTVAEMYPDPPGTAPTTVSVPTLSGRWEGASRPGHFDGVATVVVKLLSATGRGRAYFGEKDFQQLSLVIRLVRDLALPTQVVGCPTVRDADGLALSSRNERLHPDQRRAALVLSRALRAGAEELAAGSGPEAAEARMREVVAVEPQVELDYAAAVTADDLEPARTVADGRPLRLLVAATVGPVRLIDNLDPRQGLLTPVMADPGVAPVALDVLVLGSGVAGLSAAVRLAAPLAPAGARGSRPTGLRTGVLTKAELSQSATRWAQGGVAAVLGGDEDSTDLHLADTLAAGAGLCDTEAVRVLVDEGPARVNELIAMGAVFDRQPGGALALAREGGHSTARVVHAGGAATGAEVERALVDATRATAAAVLEEWFALDLLIEGGRCCGVVALSAEGLPVEVRASHTVLATGGAGQLFAVTTNPAEATADGLAMALRAGVAVADVEFMQFHPTALHHPAMPRPLLSEALRGHGALLRDAEGARFVDELAPRDLVSRAMAERMAAQGVESLWLDATGLVSFEARFPTIAASLRAIGLDPSRDWLPIAPAAHYLSGGVITDLSGATALPGLWAAGEVACTGVHGANRLASNSLLEGMVFGARLAESIQAGVEGPQPTGVMATVLDGPHQRVDPSVAAGGRTGRVAEWDPGAPTWPDVTKSRDRLQRTMIEGAGVVRSASSLAAAGATVEALGAEMAAAGPSDRAHGELANLVTAAASVLRSATVRCETRGAHARSDHPDADDRWRRRIVHDAGGVAVLAGPDPGRSSDRPTP